MIELTIFDYLSEALDERVSADYLQDEETFVLIEKTGSSVENRINRATFAIQSYAPSRLKAMELNDKVKKAMDKAVELTNISRSRLNSDYSFDDLEHKRNRYQAVYNLVYTED